MAEGLNAGPLLTFIHTQPEFQGIPTYTQLLEAVVRQMYQNPRFLQFIRQNWQEFLGMFKVPQGPVSFQLVVAGTSPLESSLREATDIERCLQDLPTESEPLNLEPASRRLGIPHNGGILSFNSNSISIGNDEPLVAFLRTLPEFQHFRQKSQLLPAVARQLAQNNLLVQLIITQNKEEYMSLVRSLVRTSAQPVQRTLESPLGETTDFERATAPSSSVAPRISQLQSEPVVHDCGLAIESVPESAEPNGAIHARKLKKRKREEKIGVVTKVSKKVEETQTVDLQCKICMDEQVGVVFLPCGHLTSCLRCAERIFDCPMCRQHITGKVKIYLN